MVKPFRLVFGELRIPGVIDSLLSTKETTADDTTTRGGGRRGGEAGNRGRTKGVDDLDRRIITMLQSDGRMANTEIARSLDVTETTVRKRIARLLDEGLINVVAVPTPTAVGMNLLGNHRDLRRPHRHACHRRPAARIPRGPLCRDVSRPVRRDARSVLHRPGTPAGVRDRQARRREGIEKVETSIILKVVKFSYEWEIV